jgi:hypothetical protein
MSRTAKDKIHDVVYWETHNAIELLSLSTTRIDSYLSTIRALNWEIRNVVEEAVLFEFMNS